jgi:hypothetical protein
VQRCRAKHAPPSLQSYSSNRPNKAIDSRKSAKKAYRGGLKFNQKMKALERFHRPANIDPQDINRLFKIISIWALARHACLQFAACCHALDTIGI